MNSHTAARSASPPPGSASRSLRSIRSEPSALVRATPAGSSTNAAAHRAASWAIPRRGSGSASARWSSASTIASAGVGDGLLAFGVGPAGAVGDQLAGAAEDVHRTVEPPGQGVAADVARHLLHERHELCQPLGVQPSGASRRSSHAPTVARSAPGCSRDLHFAHRDALPQRDQKIRQRDRGS